MYLRKDKTIRTGLTTETTVLRPAKICDPGAGEPISILCAKAAAAKERRA